MTYYAVRWTIKANGTLEENDRKSDNRAEMDRQYHLYCANAATNADGNLFDAVEWGTFEGGKLDRKTWDNRVAE